MPKFNAEQLNETDDLDEIEFYNFQWQQKEFSAKELKRYSKLENCPNDRTKEYHRQITEHTKYFDGNGEINYTGKIFSYVNDDNYSGEPIDEQNILAKNVRQFGQWQANSDFGMCERCIQFIKNKKTKTNQSSYILQWLKYVLTILFVSSGRFLSGRS